MGRRTFSGLGFVGLALAAVGAAGGEVSRPNVVLIVTDDQGYGDLGAHGNPVLRTPNLDRLASQGVRLTRFQVSPVCAPTRASLLTGRYNYRTGVVDTFLGRALMHTDEVTLAERLAGAGYRTAIFGKWHLGDNAPMRPIDQGFQEALVIKGGGIGQPSDPPGGSHYFDPVLQHDGRPETRKGYCSDVFTDAAIAYLGDRREPSRPFFVYLAFNAPHVPLEVPDADRKPYDGADLSAARFPKVGAPLPGPIDHGETARVYGMVANIDANVGRLLARLDALGLADDTLVVFLTDNGPQQVRYNGGLRGRKGGVFDGGIRVPCVLRWPGRLAGTAVDRITAHVDLAPTILEACGVPASGPAFDGVSLWPLITGRVGAAGWPDRTLFTQWHRGDAPERFRSFAARDQRYKLLRPEGQAAPFFLFDTEADPFESRDLAAEKPEVVARLKAAYSAWFDDVSRTRGFDPPPRIFLGSAREDPTILTRQDWRGPRAGNGLGYWDVEVVRAGSFDLALRFPPDPAPRTARFALGNLILEVEVPAGVDGVAFPSIPVSTGPGRLEAELRRQGGEATGVHSVEVHRRD